LLKQRTLPVAAALDCLLKLGRWGMNSEVEIEFAVDLSRERGQPAGLGFVQMRPLARGRGLEALDLEQVDAVRVLVRSQLVMGDGRTDHLSDVLVVDRSRFDRAKTKEIAWELAEMNAELVARGIPYILFGLGRWGSADPWLGIPVTWDQISGARVMVESGLIDMTVAPSQGSHFFQNLTSLRVGYFTVAPAQDDSAFLDWDWLAAQPAVKEGTFVRLLHFKRPLPVLIDGRRQAGVILKPEPD
jgi:hypothetical protein